VISGVGEAAFALSAAASVAPDDKIWLYCTIGKYQITRLGLYSRKQKLHIQKYDGLGNIENPIRALEVTLGSSTDTNSGHNHTKFKKTYRKKIGIFESHFSGSSWPLIKFIIVFSISVTRATQNNRQN
jgi:hypothetical protein